MIKKTIIILLVTLMNFACGSNSSTDDEDTTQSSSTNYRTEMRSLVQEISAYAKGINSGFIIIPQNGHALLTGDGEATGVAATAYINAINGVGREDLYYGFDNDNTTTQDSDKNDMLGFMDVAKNNDLAVLVTDYCSTQSYVDDSYQQNNTKNYISFAADRRELNNIPSYPSTPYNVSSADISSLSSAQNFLYLLNTNDYDSKSAFVTAAGKTRKCLALSGLYALIV